MRSTRTFSLKKTQEFKDQLLHWSRQYEEVLWLDSNNHVSDYSSFEVLMAADALTSIKTDYENAFQKLEEYRRETNDWIFGYLSYDLKNDQENLCSKNHDGAGFPEMCFFQPKKLIWVKAGQIHFSYLKVVEDELLSDFEVISGIRLEKDKALEVKNDVHIKLRMFKDEYFKQVSSLLSHIHRGDIYEANFCQEFFAENTHLDALSTYKRLNSISKAPFACYLKIWDNYLLSASPERYLRKRGDEVISQPIKGTAKRSKDFLEDEELKRKLREDEKERAENIMIVDLVRNDLAKHAVKGGVTVEELCEIYTYEQVHQMVSTVSAQMKKGGSPVAILRDSFPMGSMTGAPKISAMKLIESHENFKRGLYSGAVGYFDPDGNFDFNVVIRSIVYQDSKKYVSFSVGSAITAKAIPEKEYEECLLKAKAMRHVLENG
ncbi:anthranilate synthase component I family protein [Euzebyella saccharophila]|uniref:Anthranilate synthase component I family protein n=1 Tax=Euzebyella saccharophila TaxID=679664 RepID=A0ABV8JVQ6_9FLAO|nr:anthranilate synthase component I family protein [Euzebyella saccharophila]